MQAAYTQEDHDIEGERFHCSRCGSELRETRAYDSALLYYHCPVCVHHSRMFLDNLADIGKTTERPYGSGCIETFRPDVPGTRPRELEMTLPPEEVERRDVAHWTYLQRHGLCGDGSQDDDVAAARELEALTTTHQTGTPCPACEAYSPPQDEREPDLSDPEDLTLEALREQYYALLDAHAQLQQEYDDLEVAYHATIKHRDRQPA